MSESYDNRASQREAVMYHLGRVRAHKIVAQDHATKQLPGEIADAIMRDVLTPEVGSFNAIGNIVDGYMLETYGHRLEPDVTAEAELKKLQALIDTPYTADWVEGVKLEAAHQIKRWGTDHDRGKEPSDWYWLLGWLGGKALMAALRGDLEKAKHHTISCGAVLLNWHRRLMGEDVTFMPGADPAQYKGLDTDGTDKCGEHMGGDDYCTKPHGHAGAHTGAWQAY